MAQEHQEYIQQKVNPILENLVTQLLLERPEQLAPFMIKWLSDNAKTPAAAALTAGVSELSDLKTELDKLNEEVGTLESVADSNAKAGGGSPGRGDSKNEKPADDSEEEDEEDDTEDVEMPPPTAYLNKARASVSAEAYGQWNQKGDWTAPVYMKTEDQKMRIKGVLQACFLFAALEEKAIGVVISAMQEKVVDANTRVINQGEDGDLLYVIEEGQLNCFKKMPDGEEKMVKECKAGMYFGELALLYNCPRAASVIAQERCVLWHLDRESFNNIVRDAAQKRREQYEKFLKTVPILESLDTYELGTMCDALQAESFKAGDAIVKQGDAGDKFFILEEGTCEAEKVYASGTNPIKVMTYSSGDYFGELALLNNEPRAATIKATTDVRCLVLSRKTFTLALGPLKEILTRKAAEYK